LWDREGVSFTRLDTSAPIKPFDCDDSDLNDFLLNDAAPSQDNLISVSYIVEDESRTIAFYSLLNDRISAELCPSNRWYRKNIRDHFPDGKRYESYPAVKVGRLGVHKDFQGQGIGEQLLDFLKQTFVHNNRTGCRFITIDAYNNPRSISFYQRNGFDFLDSVSGDDHPRTRLMYFDLITLKNVLGDGMD
jgi:GNAT superfamily N-acetyltransferase